MSESNLSTFELMDARVRLADDVSVVPIAHGCETAEELCYQIKLASQGRFFQIGYAEYVLCSLLNGGNTIAQAMTLTSRVIPSDSFTEDQVSQLITWLIDNGLAVPVNEKGRHLALAKRKSQSRWQWNPFWTKLPFANPDQFLEKMLPTCGWLASPWMLLAVVLLWFLAGNALANHWDEFIGSSRHLFSSTNWIWLGLAWIGLKLVHELAHGIVCKKYGGKVPEAGIIMILFAPMAFVDATSSWGFSSKWKRIHVAAAGMILELMISALAIICWANTSSEALQFMLYNIVIMSGVSTLLFNANPLMRFDGYYILSDLTGIPNLYSTASRVVTSKLSRVMYGKGPKPQRPAGWRGVVVYLYGVLAFAWRMLVTCSLMIAASVLWEGVGLVLAVAGVGMWFGMPLWKVIHRWFWMIYYKPAQALRAGAIGSALGAIVIAIIFVLPCPGTAQAPGIVEFKDLTVVRPGTSGFVKHVHVQTGEYVAAGTLLLELENEELLVDVEGLKAEVAQAQARQRAFQTSDEVGLAQIEGGRLVALRNRLNEKQQQLENLKVVAPVDGHVVGRNFNQLVGQYLKEGDQVLALGDEQTKEFQVSVGQDVLDIAESLVGEERTVHVFGTQPFRGTIKMVSPRASRVPPHEALCAPYGGDLSVLINQDSEEDGESEYVLDEPRFLVTVQLDSTTSERVFAGQRGVLRLGFGTRSIARVGYDSLSKWIRKKLEEAERV